MSEERRKQLLWSGLLASLVFFAVTPFFVSLSNLTATVGLLGIDAVVAALMLFLVRPWRNGWSVASRAWIVLMTVPLLRMVSNIGDVVSGAPVGLDGFPSWTNFVWYVAQVMVIIGAFFIPHGARTGPAKSRLALDITAGTIAMLALTWIWYLEPLLQGTQGSNPNTYQSVVGFVFVTIDVMVLVAAVVISTRRSIGGSSLQLLVITAALVANGLGNTLIGLFTAGLPAFGLTMPHSMAMYGIADVLLLTAALVALKRTQPQNVGFFAPKAALGPHVLTVILAITSVVTLLTSPVAVNTVILQLSTLTVGLVLVLRQSIAIRETTSFLNHQRDQLVASVSHELRTPITGVAGFASILAESFDYISDEERIEYIGYISRQAERLGRIIGDLVGLARDTLSTTPLETRPILVSDLVSEAIEAVSDEVVEVRNIEVRIPQPLIVSIDHQRGVQILGNLIVNAMKYSHRNVLIRAAQTDPSITITVGDDGEGVPPRLRSAIFERFERGLHRFDANIPGNGLGLPIALALARAHGGTITVGRCPELGGAEFRLTLPAVRIPGERTKSVLQSGKAVAMPLQ